MLMKVLTVYFIKYKNINMEMVKSFFFLFFFTSTHRCLVRNYKTVTWEAEIGQH